MILLIVVPVSLIEIVWLTWDVDCPVSPVNALIVEKVVSIEDSERVPLEAEVILFVEVIVFIDSDTEEVDPCVISFLMVVSVSLFEFETVWLNDDVDCAVSPDIGFTVESEKALLVSVSLFVEASGFIDWLVETSKPLTVLNLSVEPVKGVDSEVETVIFACVLNEEIVESLIPVNSDTSPELDPCVITFLVIVPVSVFEIVWLTDDVDCTVIPVIGFTVESIPLEPVKILFVEVSVLSGWLELSVEDWNFEVVAETSNPLIVIVEPVFSDMVVVRSKPLIVLRLIVEPVKEVDSEEVTVESPDIGFTVESE